MSVFNEETYLYDRNINSELFHLYAFGKLFPDPNYIIARKSNPDTIIECVLEGMGYIEYEGFVTTVQSGDCYVLRKGKGHCYYSDDKTPYTKIWVTVSGIMVEKWLDLYDINTTPFVRSFDMTPYYSQIKQITLSKPDFDTEKRLMLLVHDIIFEMGMTAPKSGVSHKIETPYIKTNDNVIIDIRKYIEKMCNQRLTVKDLSIKFGLSQGTLSKMFTSKYGISPSNYHMQCKLNSAVYFLESTDLSIDMISETTGFYDRSHFRKAFAARYGIGPGEYRRNYLNQAKD